MRLHHALLALSVLFASALRPSGVLAEESLSTEQIARRGANTVVADATPKTELDPENATDLIVISGACIGRWRFFPQIDGVPARRVRREAIELLLKRYDADGSGTLSVEESATLPTPFSIRQLAAGRLFLATAPPPESADLDGDARLSPEELELYYGMGDPSCIVRWGSAPHAIELGYVLARAYDLDGHKIVERDILAAAGKRPLALDSNRDGLVSPGELMPNVRYPGTSATNVAISMDAQPEITVQVWPAVRPPSDSEHIERIVRRLDLDGDKSLSEAELLPSGIEFMTLDGDADHVIDVAEFSAWLARPPRQSWIANLTEREVSIRYIDLETGDCGPEQARVWINTPAVNARIHGSAAPRQAALQAVRGLAAQFMDLAGGANLDAAGEFSAVPNRGEIERLVKLVDADHDGRATAGEMDSWRWFTELALRSQVVVAIVDLRTSFFAYVDENHDGALSQIELDQSLRRIQAISTTGQAPFNPTSVPRQWRVCVSLGEPLSLLDSQRTGGPRWLEAMDRNRDGVVLHREFLGTDEQFHALDTDADGAILPAEALRPNSISRQE